MHVLRNCDFCGAEAVGTFEVVPPELEPTPAERRRTLLCAACRNRLETLLEPLLERAVADEAVDTDGSGSIAVTTVGGNERTTTERPGKAALESSEAALESSEAVETDAAATDASNEAEAATSGANSEGENAGTASRSDATVGSANAEPPEHYGKVVRLLRNREFPMKRREFESLAANAYDLEGRAVEAIVDYAIDQGELTQKGGNLHRP